MELVERAVLDLTSPPDRGLGFEQRDLELVQALGRMIESLPEDSSRVLVTGSSNCGLQSDRFMFFGSEGDRAGVVLVELETVGELVQQISEDLALVLGGKDVVGGGHHESFSFPSRWYSQSLSCRQASCKPLHLTRRSLWWRRLTMLRVTPLRHKQLLLAQPHRRLRFNSLEPMAAGSSTSTHRIHSKTRRRSRTSWYCWRFC